MRHAGMPARVGTAVPGWAGAGGHFFFFPRAVGLGGELRWQGTGEFCIMVRSRIEQQFETAVAAGLNPSETLRRPGSFMKTFIGSVLLMNTNNN